MLFCSVLFCSVLEILQDTLQWNGRVSCEVRGREGGREEGMGKRKEGGRNG